jgi:tyrosyl-tRNA synthetase
MPRYYYLTSSFELEVIEQVLADLAADTLHPNKAKRQLAANIVAEYWGEQAALEAEQAFDRVFKQHELPEEIALYEGVITPDEAGEVYLPQVIADAGLTSSASEARRMIDGGGVKVAGRALAAKEYNVAASALEAAVLQVGKRRYVQLP